MRDNGHLFCRRLTQGVAAWRSAKYEWWLRAWGGVEMLAQVVPGAARFHAELGVVGSSAGAWRVFLHETAFGVGEGHIVALPPLNSPSVGA